MAASATDRCSPSCGPRGALAKDKWVWKRGPAPVPPGSCHAASQRCRVVGLVALPRAPARPEHPASHHSPQNSGDAEAEVDKFINDNNEDDEDDDNINN